MEAMRPPSEEEINKAYDAGREAVVALIYDVFMKMSERMMKLEDQIAKNSGNSGKPPSSDGLGKKPKSLREKSKKRVAVSMDMQGAD